MTARHVGLALWLMASAPALAAQSLHYEGALSVATGKYIFAERTTTWALSTGLAAGLGPFTLRASLPAYLQNTTLLTTSPFGRLPTGGSSTGAVADSGAARRRHDGSGPRSSHGTVEVPRTAATGFDAAVGDPTMALSWRAVGAGRTHLSAGAAVKAPLADTAAFGTGEWDFGATAALSWMPSVSTVLGLDLAYWHLGDFGALDFRDPVYGTASLGYLAPTGWGGSVFASAGTSALEGYDGPVSVGAALTRVRGATGWSLAVSAGLTETAPAFTLGLSWRVRMARRR